MQKRTLFILLLLVIAFIASPLYSAPKLDVGAEYRLRGIQYSNPTYASEQPLSAGNTVDQKYYSHRARVYMKGKFDPGIEIGAIIQAIGVAGSTQTIAGHYPKEDFTPFMENIYLQANDFHELPVSFTIGRQPYVWGSGLLLADDGLGFDGIRIEGGPFWGMKTHLFTAKAVERLGGESADKDVHLAGISFNWGIHNVKLGWIYERDGSGTPYSNLSSTNSVASDKITRQYYDLQVGGRLEQGAFYNAEFALQGGKVLLPGPAGGAQQEIKLSGSALTFEGGFDFIHPRYKRMILAFVFMQGSGDDAGSSDQDERFNPSFGHKLDGLERSGYGEFFAATPYSFFNEDKVIVVRDRGLPTQQSAPYDTLFSGLRMYGFHGSINPIDPLVMGLEFYLYNAREVPTQGVGRPPFTITGETALGRELVITISYTYARYINLGLRWGKFFPTQNLNNVGSSRLMFEASAKF